MWERYVPITPTVLRFRMSRFSRNTEKSVSGEPAAVLSPLRMAIAPTL